MSLMSNEAVDVSLMLLVTVEVVTLVTLSPKSLPLYHQHKLTANIQCYPSIIDHAIEMMPLIIRTTENPIRLRSLTILPPPRGEEKRLGRREKKIGQSRPG